MAGPKYAAAPVPFVEAELPQFLAEELRLIADAMNQHTCAFLRLDQQFAAPANPQDGTIAFADGTSWNPGGGQGIYAYYGAAWNKL